MPVPELSRRTALASAAWAPPAVVLASGAPAFATSSVATSRYELDWAVSGYEPAASPTTKVDVVAVRVEGTAGPATLPLRVSAQVFQMNSPARWQPGDVERDMTLASDAVVNGRQGLVLSSQTRTNEGFGQSLEDVFRSLVLEPVGFDWRAFRIETGEMLCRCSGHPFADLDLPQGNDGTGEHQRMDALTFKQGYEFASGALRMVASTGGLVVETDSYAQQFFVATADVASAVFEVEDPEALIQMPRGGNAIQIGYLNRCGGKKDWHVMPDNDLRVKWEWDPWQPLEMVFGTASFKVDFEA